MPVISGGGGGVAPSSIAGYEISYTQITASVNIVSTTEATGTTILSPGAVTFDGGLVLVEFFAPLIITDTTAINDVVTVSLFEGATQITRFGAAVVQSTSVQDILPFYARYRFTPTAAAHTYTVTAFSSTTTGTPRVLAGAGGTAAYPPAFVRFSKV